MKHIVGYRFMAVALIVLSLGLVHPAIAQDAPLVTNTPVAAETAVVIEPPLATEAPPIVVEPPTPAPAPSILDSLDFREFTPWLGAILLAVVVGFFYVASKVVVQLAAGIPQFAWEGVRAGANSGLAEIEKYVLSTPNTLDDAAFAELKKKVEAIEASVDELRRNPAAISEALRLN